MERLRLCGQVKPTKKLDRLSDARAHAEAGKARKQLERMATLQTKIAQDRRSWKDAKADSRVCVVAADVADLFEVDSRVSRSRQSDFWLCWCRVRLSTGRSLYKAFGGRSEADVKWNVRVRGGTGDNVTFKDVRPEVRESVIGVGR